MSHFAVLVVGDDPEYQLAPFHEFECTGYDDEFVVDEDVTEENREEYADGTVRRIVEVATGRHLEDREYYRPPNEEEQKKVGFGSGCGGGISWHSQDWGDGKGYSARVHYVPMGCEERDIPFSELYTFREFVEEYQEFSLRGSDEERCKYRYFEANAAGEVSRIINRSNPDKKWDYWRAGGRYGDSLLLMDGRRVDSGRVGDLDFEGMAALAEARALERFDKVLPIIKEHGVPPTFARVKECCTEGFEWLDEQGRVELARDVYAKHPAVKAIREARLDYPFSTLEEQFTNFDRDAHAAKAQAASFQYFAFVKDRKWAEKGRMGWWACVSDEKADWPETFQKLVSELNPDDIVTVVDCHI